MSLKRRLFVTSMVAGLIALAGWFLLPYVRGLYAGLDEGPVLVELGRGSGWHGLDTVRILKDGTAILHRYNQDGNIEMVRLQLPATAMAKVAAAIERHSLLSLDNMYSDSNIADGTQWVLRFNRRATYFNNRFPEQITQFAESLDRILSENGLETAGWSRVAYSTDRRHEQELWDSIKR